MERSLIQGKVKIVADDRTNILIIITRPTNSRFLTTSSPPLISRLNRMSLLRSYGWNMPTQKKWWMF